MGNKLREKYTKASADWHREKLENSFSRFPQRQEKFATMSGIPVKPLYGPDDLPEDDNLLEQLGFPGEYPYTRGPQSSMYRSKHWTMRQFAGFGSAEDTNARFRYLLNEGQNGLSVAFDLPTLMGYDSDHVFSRGEVGREGVAIDTLKDMEILFENIPLDKVTTSMTINAPAIILICMLAAVAEKQGVPLNRVGGTCQNDMFKEFIAQKEWIVGPEPSTKLVVDTMEWCSEHMPRWNTISISGYHIREAGATGVQELAFTLADGIGYVEAAIERGMDVDSFAPRLSFFFDVHNDFFEEIAKFRAARRIWADIMKNRFKAKNPKSWLLRTHAQTAGVSLTAQQPYNNIVRVAIQALAGVLEELSLSTQIQWMRPTLFLQKKR
jgi:methylmalonyl-CoA mutase N-terminal domain/subunit